MSILERLESSRRAKRAQVYMSGELVVNGVAAKVTIRDISVVGAHIVTAQPLPRGSAAQLKRGTLDAAATVAWVRGKEAGLQFDQPLEPTTLDRSMPKAVTRSISRPSPRDPLAR